MKLRAIHQRERWDGKKEEPVDVVIIGIFLPDPDANAVAVFVRPDGSMGEDVIRNFTITEGAW